MKECDAVTLYESRFGDRDDEIRIDDHGRLLDPDGKDVLKLKLRRATLASTDAPSSLVDWCVSVTTVDNDHVHSEVTNHRTGMGWSVLTLPDPDAVVMLP